MRRVHMQDCIGAVTAQLTGPERVVGKALFDAARAAHVWLVRLGDSVLLRPRARQCIRGVRVELDDYRAANIIRYLRDWVAHSP